MPVLSGKGAGAAELCGVVMPGAGSCCVSQPSRSPKIPQPLSQAAHANPRATLSSDFFIPTSLDRE